MILPQAQDRDIVVFHVWPSLAYRKRLISGFALMGVGVLVQLVTASFLPGGLLIAVGNLLLLVRGYDNRVDSATFDPAAEWERVDFQRLDDLEELHRKMRRWDTSALDVSNVLGAVLFIVLTVALGALTVIVWSVGHPLYILLLDAMILLLPHWITGTRRILVQPRLMVRVNTVREVLKGQDEALADHQVHLLMLLRGGTIPDDLKFRVDIKDRDKDFLGLYGQVVLNEVQGKSYPYFYVVLVARRGYGLEATGKGVFRPGVTTEFKVQDQVEVFVIRQKTTKTSGYHTKPGDALLILGDGLGLAERIAVKERTPAK